MSILGDGPYALVSHKWGSYYMGADHIAGALFYFLMMYYKQYTVALALTGVELAYYGPMGLSGPAAGILGGLALL